jgi:pilus assembly protein Flp/PilA
MIEKAHDLALRAYVDAKTWSKKHRKGASAIEYGLLAGLIAVVIIGTVASLGSTLNTVFSNIQASLSTVT